MGDPDLDFWQDLSDGPVRGRGRRRRRRKGRGRRIAPLIAVIFLAAVVGGGGYLGITTVNRFINPPDFKGGGTVEVTVRIQDGDSVKNMARRLQDAKVVKSADAFVKAAKNEPGATNIQPGYYRLRLHMSAATALTLLLDPASRAGRITIPEGRRVAAILPFLAHATGIPLKEFQRAARNTAALGLPSYAHGRLEGYLYPFTYDLAPNVTATEVLRMMVAKFKQVAQQTDLEDLARAQHMSPSEVVTTASLIQAESGRLSDMPKISRVIANRLHSPQLYLHRLQLDSTVMYALGKFGIVAGAADLQTPSPFNTYQHAGLPPGAICNPGEVALNAALNPTKGPWVYFVTTDPKHRVTKFTASHNQFVKFRQELQRNLGHG